nr:AAA family ATPase [Salinimicrobium terrae]
MCVRTSQPFFRSALFTYSENYKKLLNRGRKGYNDEQKKLEQELKYPSYILHRNFRKRFNEHAKTLIGTNAVHNQFFVPAGRSFFANLQSGIFSFLSTNKSLDPFLLEFGSFYENFKRIALDSENSRRKNFPVDSEALLSEILNGTYLREKEKDFILHKDNRKVNLSNASSGQQETLPLVTVLKVLNYSSFFNGGATLYIEEPEAHLFPTAQMKW